MTDHHLRAQGTPVWVDLASPEPVEAAFFYCGLFGWDALDLGPDADGHKMFSLNGKRVAAVGFSQERQPPAWSLYLATKDADAAARSVVAAGGTVVAPPLDVLDQGRMAILRDPSGAVFSVWQPTRMNGAELMGEPGSYTWAELNTRDLTSAEGFYCRVFGWGVRRGPSSAGGAAFTEWQVGERSFGGCIDMSGMPVPAEIPPFWLVYFGVLDVDAAAAKVAELGGRVETGPSDFRGGRLAVVSDTHQAVFGLLERERP